MKNDTLKAFILDDHDTHSVENNLNKILAIIRSHLGMDVAFISQFTNGERVFKLVDAKNVDSAVKVGGSDPLGETYCKRITDNELDNIIHNTSENSITKNLDVTEKLAIGSYMGVPIWLSNGSLYGTFCCFKNEADDTLNERDLSFLKVIADIASGLIEKKILLESEYQEITKKIQTVLDTNSIEIHYQPIYSLHTKRIAGFESLSRFISEPYRPPNIWFDEASQVGLGESLEIMAIKKAIKNMNKFDNDTYISVNASPEYILNGSLATALDDVDANRIVLEVTEHARVDDYSLFRQSLNTLRERGIRLAIDDAGAGYSSFQHILRLEPDIIKLDMSLIQNIHQEQRKYLLAKALCAFSKAIECTVIAEGVETTEELDVLKELGVDKVQGYLLGRPMSISDAITYDCKNC